MTTELTNDNTQPVPAPKPDASGIESNTEPIDPPADGEVPGVSYGEAMTQASIREVSRLCRQAAREFQQGEPVKAASSLELAKGILLPALGWLFHVSGIDMDANDTDSAQESEAAEREPELDELPGFYL